MRTRCPQCGTIFRVTPEQLRFRAGKVRCGHCQAVFNALDTLLEEPPAPPLQRPAFPEVVPVEPTPQVEAPPPAAPEPLARSPEPMMEPAAIVEPESMGPAETPAEPASPETAAEPEPTEALAEPEPAAEEPEPEIAPPSVAPMTSGSGLEQTSEQEPEAESERDETPEESTQAAREAGLVAARELAEAPGYNRWAAGTLASTGPLSRLEAEGRHRITWPFVVAAVLLVLTLAAQLTYHFRTEVALRLPDAAALFTALGIDIPLPQDANQVSIEASDLQADAARGLLVLQATLKNRAPYAQAWPALELTLTDTHDAVVARRVLYAPDYLPRSADTAAFAGNGEIAIRLWIEAQEVAAAGYRLYVFYP